MVAFSVQLVGHFWVQINTTGLNRLMPLSRTLGRRGSIIRQAFLLDD